MSNDVRKMTARETEPFVVDSFRPEDAEGIARLFRSVYGEHYPIRLFYDPDAIIAANREGRYYSIVARTPAGKVIGASHLYRSAPCPVLYESGAGLVLREYRNTSVYGEIVSYVIQEFIPKHRGRSMEAVWAELTCNHTIVQKKILPLGYEGTAIEVALMPAEAYIREENASRRVATLDVFRCHVPKPHRVHLPRVYEAALRCIYGRFNDDRDIGISQEALPAGQWTAASLDVFDFARVARITVPAAGADFSGRVSELEGKAREREAVVFQVFLNMTEPWVGEAVEILRDQGYFFGGALPRWFDGDGLLMQKLDCYPDFEGIVLLHESSQELLACIREDWERQSSR